MSNPIVQSLETALDRAIRRATFRQRAAAAFTLSSYADAEAGGENLVFERALKRATDPAIAKMIRKHQQDEVRHAAMITARREALGLPEMDIPAHLKLVQRLSDEAGHVLDRPMDDDADIVAVYALLYVVEQRAIEAFERSIGALRAVGDDATAEMFAEIANDEHMHIKYCAAVGCNYAGSDEAFAAEVEKMREIEARVYGQVSRGYLMWLLKNHLLELPAAFTALLGGIVGMAEAFSRPAPRMHGPIGLAA